MPDDTHIDLRERVAALEQMLVERTAERTRLGLSISWDIVTQQHGGAIAVDSRVGEFTEFTIRLPRREPTRLSPSC